MAAKSGRSSRPVRDLLFSEPHTFDLYQAIRLLERERPYARPVGEGRSAADEAVRFEALVTVAFTGPDIVDLTPGTADFQDRDDPPPTMTTTTLGLAGHNGPLPSPYTRMVLEEQARGNLAPRMFFDMFNHRLISLLYRIRVRCRVALWNGPPHSSPVGQTLLSVIGLGTPSLRERIGVRDLAMVRYAGLLAGGPRGAIVLETILADHYDLKGCVHVRSLKGQWNRLRAEDLTKIGWSGQNKVLGQTAILGRRIWDQQGAIDIEIGPLPYDRFRSMLPDHGGANDADILAVAADHYGGLIGLINFVLDHTVVFRITFQVDPETIPDRGIGRGSDAVRLSWNAWLGKSKLGDRRATITRPNEAVS